MIGYIEGEIIATDERGVIVLAQGVGWRVFTATTSGVAPSVGEKARFWTHLAVRDDALDLYGFSTQSDLRMFQALLSVSGIGPKSAASILGAAGINTLLHAILGRDASYLVKTSGIGKKTAEKLILELHDKRALLPEQGEDAPELGPEHEALDALEALGYAARDVRELVQEIAKEERSSEDIIRRALRELGRR